MTRAAAGLVARRHGAARLGHAGGLDRGGRLARPRLPRGGHGRARDGLRAACARLGRVELRAKDEGDRARFAHGEITLEQGVKR